MRQAVIVLLFVFGFAGGVMAGNSPVMREWTIDGVVREALVGVPPQAKANQTPVVFIFHGHGETMNQAAENFNIHGLWPEAIVVYMQGLNTPYGTGDHEGKQPGWQRSAGVYGDRDFKFVNEVLKSLQRDYHVDKKRVYATGHANGGSFVYLLWGQRADSFAGFAPSAASAARALEQFKPKPVLQIAGEKDVVTKFEWQQKTIEGLRKLNQCGEGQPWMKGCMLYPSKIGAPVATFIHPGAHSFPPRAPAIIVDFFRDLK